MNLHRLRGADCANDHGVARRSNERVLTRRQFVEAAVAATAAQSLVVNPGRALEAFSIGLTSRAQSGIERDLIEVDISRLRQLYATRKYTVTQVTRWYLDRIARYDRVYRAVWHVDAQGAMAAAAALDTAVRNDARRGPLWGVPIVIKANTSVKGLVTSNGWTGYLIPGHELVAPSDATIVSKLRAAGAIILGQTNMPDFAASDTTISSAFGRTGNAYDSRFSPGGSSGGTVTAAAGNFCVLGTGTDTGNSIRMPAATSALVGLLPTRGLVSIAGIHPLDWLLDNAGPIARNVTDVAIALDVMAGEDPKDFRTRDSAKSRQPAPFTAYLKVDALRGRRFGVPAFTMRPPTPTSTRDDGSVLQPETRALFLKAVDELRAAGAEVVVDEAFLTSDFLGLVSTVNTQPYRGQGVEDFLRDYGPADYHSSLEYAQAVGSPLPLTRGSGGRAGSPNEQRRLEGDPQADTTFFEPQRRVLSAYNDALDRLRLDGLVYPAIQMPPNDETLPLREGNRSFGPHSQTSWVNVIGVPAISVPGGFYANGLPFGIEMSAKRWRDGDLLGWAFAYEQATKHRRPPTLVDRRR
jgi:Asp-tRNA(Asn)/Glu-tRNA(Gln) amidotransferase A subunit family amidase